MGLNATKIPLTADERRRIIRETIKLLKAFKKKWPRDYRHRIGYDNYTDIILLHVEALVALDEMGGHKLDNQKASE